MSILLKNREIDGVKYLLNEENLTYYPTMKQDKQTGLTYTLDAKTFTYLPNLTVQTDEVIIRRWGQKRKKFLKEHREWIYLRMMDEGTLTDHLTEIDKAAEEMMELLRQEWMKKEGVTEQLKAVNQMEWLRRLNSIESRAEEVVLNKLIYA